MNMTEKHMYTAVLHRSPGGTLKSVENLGEIQKSEPHVIVFTQDVPSDFVIQRVTRLHLKRTEWHQSAHVGRSI